MRVVNVIIRHTLTFTVAVVPTIAHIAMRNRYLIFADCEIPMNRLWPTFKKSVAAWNKSLLEQFYGWAA